MITILPLCDVREIAPGLWVYGDTGKTIVEFVREEAEKWGPVDAVSLNSVEVDGDEVRVSANVRMKPDYLQHVDVKIAPVRLDPL